MAVIWQKTVGETHYQVRRAGNSLRLYTNNVFHSQFNADYPLAGSVWDLLVLPALFLPPGKIDRVLVLGVGGGAVIRQLNALVHPTEIIGVELDRVHLHIASRFFGLRSHKNVELVEADAVAWLHRYRGPKFDLIVDDLFGESPEGGTRSVIANAAWCERQLKLLNGNAVLVQNFATARGFRSTALLTDSLKSQFATGYRLWVPGCDNRVGAFFRSRVTKKDLQAGLDRIAEKHGKQIVRRLRARSRCLFG